MKWCHRKSRAVSHPLHIARQGAISGLGATRSNNARRNAPLPLHPFMPSSLDYLPSHHARLVGSERALEQPDGLPWQLPYCLIIPHMSDYRNEQHHVIPHTVRIPTLLQDLCKPTAARAENHLQAKPMGRKQTRMAGSLRLARTLVQLNQNITVQCTTRSRLCVPGGKKAFFHQELAQ